MKSLFLNLLLFPVLVVAQNQMDVTDFAASITAKELKENLYVYASDYFQGRETGTLGQRRAVDFLQNFTLLKVSRKPKVPTTTPNL